MRQLVELVESKVAAAVRWLTPRTERARGMSRLASPDVAASPMLPLAAGAIAIGVFLVDTITTLEIAIAVVYVVVVLLAAMFLRRRGVLLVSSACLALTTFSYLLQHDVRIDGALMRCLVSLSAIGIATVLALMNQSAHSVLRKQASLLDLTHDAVFVRRMDDVITYWNRGAEALYGWSGDDAIGKVSHELLGTVFPAPREEITAELIRTGRWEGELVHTKRDATQVVVSSRWSLQRTDGGEAAAVLETNTDITAAKRAQEELHHVQAELAHVSRVTMLGELSASIAHEVNQPLAAIVINAEATQRYLEQTPPKLDDARRVTDRVIQSAERASNVIRRIRALSKKAAPEMVNLDVNEVIEETVPLVRSQATSNRVVLRLQLAPGLPAVLADRIQLQQVIINLVINAIDAMKAVSDRPRELVIRTRQGDGGEVLVAVQDSGVGIEPEKANRLFDAFYTTKADGMGMGLSICRSIIEAHGGRIWASSNAGPGATLQFTLPPAGPARPDVADGTATSRADCDASLLTTGSST
jgi:two-component system, LuxR family, sensor kinase FixL